MAGNALILFVGLSEAAAAFQGAAEQRGSHVVVGASRLEALGMYVAYAPHVVVIDMSAPHASEVLTHLRSVDAAPLLLLENSVNSLRERSAAVYTLPQGLSPADVVRVALRAAQGRTLFGLTRLERSGARLAG